MNDRR